MKSFFPNTDGTNTDYLYKIIEGDRCVYCGIDAEVYDHVPPMTCCPMNGLKYPSCRRCNSFLNSSAQSDIEARKQSLIKQYAKKYKKILKMPEWEEWEIREEEFDIQCIIREGLVVKEMVLSKLEHLRGI